MRDFLVSLSGKANLTVSLSVLCTRLRSANSFWQATILRPAYYIAADDRRQLIILGIRGTTQAHDLFTDLATAGEEFLDGGYAHAGILHAAKWFVKKEAPTLKKLLQQNPVRPRHPYPYLHLSFRFYVDQEYCTCQPRMSDTDTVEECSSSLTTEALSCQGQNVYTFARKRV